MSVAAYHGHIAFSEKIAQVNDRLEMSGDETVAGYGLAEEEIQIRIGAPSRDIEHIHGSKCVLVNPAVGRDPVSLGLRHHSADFSGNTMAITSANPLLRVFEANS